VRNPVITATLLLVLLVMAGALGLVLGGGAGLQGAGPGGLGRASTVAVQTSTGPIFLVKAESVVASFSSAGSGITARSVLAPLAGVRFDIRGVQSPSAALRGPLLSYYVITNSTGMGELQVPRGNFTVAASGENFALTEILSFRANTITFLNLKVLPTYGNVTSISVSNQDTLVGVEPTGTIFADIAGRVSFTPDITSQLVGYPAGTSRTITSVDLTVVGSYDSPQGTLVVLKPLQPYPALPSNGLVLLQYKTNSTVRYIAA
jgi:hypothetical protein